MFPRLKRYLLSLGADPNSSDEQLEQYADGLRGIQRTIAALLSHDESDTDARGRADVAIRAIGFDPLDPATELPPQRQAADPPADPPASTPPAGDTAVDEEAVRRQAAAEERTRQSEIRALAARAEVSDEELERALNEGLTADQAGRRFLELRRESQGTEDLNMGLAVHSRNSVTGINRGILEAAMLMRDGMDPVDGHAERWDTRSQQQVAARTQAQRDQLEQFADQAYRYRNMSLADVLRHTLALDGIPVHGNTTEDVLVAARAMNVSHANTVAVFTTSVNARMLNAFREAQDTTDGWVGVEDVSDFRTNDRIRATTSGDMPKLPRGGTADDAQFGAGVETYKIVRYANKFVIDEQDIIDDSMGFHRENAPDMLGRAARRLRAKLVYYILLANPNLGDGSALFLAGTNLHTSAALTIANLKTAVTKMRTNQENGQELDLDPSFLITAEALRHTAIETTNAAGVVIAGSTDDLKPNMNALTRENLQLRADARIDNGVTDPDSGSTTTGDAGWWFLAGGNSPSILVGYRRGTGRQPVTRTSVLTNGQWGLLWDINMDVGAKAVNRLGIQRNED